MSAGPIRTTLAMVLPALFGLLTLLQPTGPLQAQELPFTLETPLPPGVTYDPAVPTPPEVLGHRIGEKHTPPHEVVRYFEAVAQASDRVSVDTHGRTHEGRLLIHALVTTPERQGRLEELRRANLRLSDEPGSVSDQDLAGMPTVAYMGYSIHGNEASGSEAAILLLYHLAAGRGDAVDEVLENVVVLINPMFNPDGRDRFTDWVNRNRGGVATSDPLHREHNEPWPGGRTNHYWFDLNRDWLPLVHPESRGRVALFHRWRPQVLTDYHEMGSDNTYFFMPGIQTRIHPATPQVNQELTARLAAYHARNLDQVGALYYSEETFDDYYVGKGSTFPDAQGAVGILFEQASSRALRRETINGVLDYDFTVRNQFLASLSTLEGMVDLRVDLLTYQRDFYAGAEEAAESQEVKAWVVSLDEARTRSQMLARLLQSHRIRVHALASDVEAGGKTYRAGEAWIVPARQPQSRFLTAIMERRTTFTDSLFYDVSAWTLPLAYDVTYAELRRDVGSLLGQELDSVELDGGELVGGTAEYAYLMPWDRYFAPRALHRFQAAGALPRLMTAPFSARVGSQVMSFPAGTVVIPANRPDEDVPGLHDLARTAVEEDHVRLYATSTGLTPSGGDLGSPSAEVLEGPHVAILSGEGTSGYDVGETWHLLSERMEMPVTLLDLARVQETDLSRYDVLILSGGSFSGLSAARIREWVARGGRLVALESGAEWVVEAGLMELEPREVDLSGVLAGKSWADLDQARGAQVIGGSIFQAELDETHPLAFGIGHELPVFRQGIRAYEPTARPGVTVARYTSEPLLSGYVSEERLEQLRGSAAALADELGRGTVTLIMDDPDFRGFWYGTDRLLLNAVFFGDAY